MITWGMILAAALAAESGRGVGVLDLPHCSNRVVNEVVRRAGCTLGDMACWSRSGGYCTDYVERRLLAAAQVPRLELVPVPAEQVRAGDVAVFTARAHYALVERAVRDASGRIISVDVAEHNFGTCWVDRDLMITDHYKTLGRRRAIPVTAADGGFLRARPVGP